MEMMNVSVVFVEGDLVFCSGICNAFPFVAVCCCLSLTVWVAMSLARGWRIPGALCIIVRWVVVSWNTGTLALGLFCNRRLHSSFFGTLGCYHLLLYWRKLVLVVWSYKFYYTRKLHYSYTILFWCSFIDILVFSCFALQIFMSSLLTCAPDGHFRYCINTILPHDDEHIMFETCRGL